MKKKIFIAFLFISLFPIISCEKDNPIDLTGSLKVIFSSNSTVDFSKVSCYIYILENPDYALHLLHPDSQGIVYVNNLNHGNYILVYYHLGVSITQYFQISAGKETLFEFTLPIYI